MACNTRCYSGPYYPCPTCFNFCGCDCSPNIVINPPVTNVSFAFATASGNLSVLNGETVPLLITNSEGTSITMLVLGDIELSPGTYIVNYNLRATDDNNEDLDFALYLNGALVPTSQSSLGVQNTGMLSNQVIITVTQNSTLTLLNIGNDATLSDGNMSVTKI